MVCRDVVYVENYYGQELYEKDIALRTQFLDAIKHEQCNNKNSLCSLIFVPSFPLQHTHILVTIWLHVLCFQVEDLKELERKMNTGLEKLAEATESVDVLSKELVIKEKDLEVANKAADKVCSSCKHH